MQCLGWGGLLNVLVFFKLSLLSDKEQSRNFHIVLLLAPLSVHLKLLPFIPIIVGFFPLQPSVLVMSVGVTHTFKKVSFIHERIFLEFFFSFSPFTFL